MKKDCNQRVGREMFAWVFGVRLVGYLSLLWLLYMYLGTEILFITLTLFALTLGLLDKYILSKQRTEKDSPSLLIYNARDIWVALVVMFVLRSFFFAYNMVPTGSLEPTVKIGDIILVNQYKYGLHIPVLNTKIASWDTPKRGEIAVFRNPENPIAMMYVKRVIGVPGDHVVYKDKVLTINGQVMTQDFIGLDYDQESKGNAQVLSRRMEHMPGISHEIYVKSNQSHHFDEVDMIVPEGTYFMMGDNRDSSYDSRFFGPVDQSLLVGKGVISLFNIQWFKGIIPYPDFSRFGIWF